MKSILALTFIALVVSVSLPEKDDVLVQSESNFQEALQTDPNLLVEFYAPWCGHCKKLASEYAAAAKQLKSQGANVALAKVDATENQALGQQFKVDGFPNIKFFVNGEPSEYKGGRNTAAIVSWSLKRTSDAVKKLSTIEEFDQFVSANKVAAVLLDQILKHQNKLL